MKLGEKRCSDFYIKDIKTDKDTGHRCVNCPLRNIDFYGCSNDKPFIEIYNQYKDKYSPSYREIILKKLNQEVK